MDRLARAEALLKELADSNHGYSKGYSDQHYVCIWCDGCMDNHVTSSGRSYQCSPHSSECLMIKAQEFLDGDIVDEVLVLRGPTQEDEPMGV